MSRTVLVALFSIMMCMFMSACQKGRFTEDHHYVGNPERLPVTSEPARDDGDVRQPPIPEHR